MRNKNRRTWTRPRDWVKFKWNLGDRYVIQCDELLSNQNYQRLEMVEFLDMYPNFPLLEMACRSTGKMVITKRLMDALQQLRDEIGKPLIVNSAFRTRQHNKAIGGKPNSMHLYGCAVDISTVNHNVHHLAKLARQCGFTSLAYYPKNQFIHLDVCDIPAVWGTPIKEDTITFKPEKKFIPEKFTQDRDALAGLGSMASATPAILNSVAGLSLPTAVVVPCFVLAVGFIGYMIYRRMK